MRIKICGLTSVEDALAAAEAGADWIGLNFYPPSPRCIDFSVAREIVQILPASVEPVGLFVDEEPGLVAKLAHELGLRVVQLHGQEPPEDLRVLSHLTIVRAFRLDDRPSIDTMVDYLARAADLGRSPDAILVDGHAAGSPGGTGVLIEESLLRQLPALPKLILAGGLKPENVAERIRIVRPWMVDVASGVESAPGKKDRSKVEAFIKAIKVAESAESRA